MASSSSVSLGMATMDYDFISEGLARELVSGSQMLQCWEVAALLNKVLRQREKTIVTLTRSADSLNKHYKRSAIAKTTGAVAGTGGKVATGVGAAALVWAPFTGGLSLVAAAGCAVVGGVTWAAGSAVQLGTLAVENRLCSGLVTEANQAIAEDQNYVGQLKEAWEVLQCMVASFCDQFQYVMCIEKVINAVWSVYKRVKEFVTKEIVDWKGFVAKATKTSRGNVQNYKRRAVQVIKSFIKKSLEVMSLKLAGLEIQAGITLMVLGIGAVLVGLDIAVLLKNAVTLATDKEHPAAVEIKSRVETLKDERDQLQSFYRALQRCLQ